MKKRIWLLLLGVIGIGSSVSVTNAAEQSLLFYDEFPPFSYVEDNQPKGLFVDIVSAVFKSMGASIDANSYPFKRAMRMAELGQGIVVGVYKTDRRRERLDFSTPFYREKTVFLFTRKILSPIPRSMI